MIRRSLKKLKAFLDDFRRVNQSPVIVFGNQKSGTSAIAGLLAELCGKTCVIDIPPLWSEEGMRLIRGEGNFGDFVGRHRRYFWQDVIKEPNFTYFMEDIIGFYPKAQFVFVLREPKSNIRSILLRRNIPGNLNALQASHLKKLRNNFGFSKEHWGLTTEENYIDVLAERWRRAAQGYVDTQEKLRLIRYEAFRENKEQELKQLASDLGMNAVNDITDRLNHPFQPAGNSDLSDDEFFGPANLSKIEARCRQISEQLGYAW